MNFIKDYFLEENPNPERKGCPDEETLKALANGRLALQHPARLHLAACSECFAEFRSYEVERELAKHSRSRRIRLAIAASLAVALGSCAIWDVEQHRSNGNIPVASVHPLKVNLNLFEDGTMRGEDNAAGTKPVAALPRSVVDLSITLPRFSDPGAYIIQVSKDRNGSHVIAQGSGTGNSHGDRVDVSVRLDLRSVKPGTYFLATVRGVDDGIYYYPLRID